MNVRFKISQNWVFTFAAHLLEQAGIDEDTIAADLDNLVYEAGEREWEKFETDNYETFYYIED